MRKFVIFNGIKSDGLKLPQLLSQYLYQTRKLDLQGIGIFTLDADVVIPQESDRVGQVAATGIHFRNAAIPAADDSLINFIKEHTGKMKSLAAADLDFYLTTGRQLLNIGKPFYLEGIGTLIKNKEGHLDFAAGDYLLARLADSAPERRANYDDPPRDRDQQGTSTKQGMLLILIIVGLGIIGWGGYYLYKRNSFSDSAEKQALVVPETPSRGDTTRAVVPTDSSHRDTTRAANNPAPAPAVPGPATTSSKTTSPAATSPAASSPTITAATASSLTPAPGAVLYRFIILSTDNKHRALRRYNQLLGYQLNIKMDQKDSAFFKLYFPIAALPKDTAYIKDSLAETYAAPQVFVEH